MQAELFAAILAAKDGIFHRELLTDFGYPPQGPTIIYSDSKSCVAVSLDPVAFKQLKHILRYAEGRKVELKAKARMTDPDYTKIRKWIKGIGEIMDGRIKMYEQVLQFVNKDYG